MVCMMSSAASMAGIALGTRKARMPMAKPMTTESGTASITRASVFMLWCQ